MFGLCAGAGAGKGGVCDGPGGRSHVGGRRQRPHAPVGWRTLPGNTPAVLSDSCHCCRCCCCSTGTTTPHVTPDLASDSVLHGVDGLQAHGRDAPQPSLQQLAAAAPAGGSHNPPAHVPGTDARPALPCRSGRGTACACWRLCRQARACTPWPWMAPSRAGRPARAMTPSSGARVRHRHSGTPSPGRPAPPEADTASWAGHASGSLLLEVHPASAPCSALDALLPGPADGVARRHHQLQPRQRHSAPVVCSERTLPFAPLSDGTSPCICCPALLSVHPLDPGCEPVAAAQGVSRLAAGGTVTCSPTLQTARSELRAGWLPAACRQPFARTPLTCPCPAACEPAACCPQAGL